MASVSSDFFRPLKSACAVRQHERVAMSVRAPKRLDRSGFVDHALVVEHERRPRLAHRKPHPGGSIGFEHPRFAALYAVASTRASRPPGQRRRGARPPGWDARCRLWCRSETDGLRRTTAARRASAKHARQTPRATAAIAVHQSRQYPWARSGARSLRAMRCTRAAASAAGRAHARRVRSLRRSSRAGAGDSGLRRANEHRAEDPPNARATRQGPRGMRRAIARRSRHRAPRSRWCVPGRRAPGAASAGDPASREFEPHKKRGEGHLPSPRRVARTRYGCGTCKRSFATRLSTSAMLWNR